MSASASSDDDRPVRGRLANSISNAVVKVFAECLGRGPTKARTIVSRDPISVILENTFTKAERSLIERGEGETVLEMRRALERAMRGPLVEAVESLSNRRVVAFLSAQQTDPDIAIESFVLEQLQVDGGERDGLPDGAATR